MMHPSSLTMTYITCIMYATLPSTTLSHPVGSGGWYSTTTNLCSMYMTYYLSITMYMEY